MTADADIQYNQPTLYICIVCTVHIQLLYNLLCKLEVMLPNGIGNTREQTKLSAIALLRLKCNTVAYSPTTCLSVCINKKGVAISVDTEKTVPTDPSNTTLMSFNVSHCACISLLVLPEKCP